MICPRCGREIPATAERCSGCAAVLEQTVATGLLTPPPPAVSGDSPTSPAFDVDGVTGIGGRVSAGPGDAPTSAPFVAPVGTAGGGPLEPGQAFGSRYHIIRALGVGGMGAVYQAWDAELGVAIAMKVIRPEVMADPGAAAEIERRFKRELLLARQVTHKSVVRIHDLGEIDGIKYITMTYVEGEDLSTLLAREGTLPVPAVMRIARAVVSGLVEAHKVGVVHRDLKPANIMIDKAGDALIMDFGIARSSGGPKTSGASARSLMPAGLRQTAMAVNATSHGSIVGTVEYMAPEQARGQEVDQRADIYAFGLMLYDMVVGRQRRAERTESAIAELRARMEEAPPPIKSLLPEIPEAVDHLISRCIEPDREKRYQATEELAAEFDRLDDNGVPIPVRRVVGLPLAAAAATLLLAISGGAWWYARTLVPTAAHEPVSVVIADLHNGTNDPAFDHTLEPMLKRALEGAGFISAFDRNGITRTLGVRPPEILDEAAARTIAIKQGLGVVLSGAIERNGKGYGLSMKATQTVTGNVLATATSSVSNKDQVLGGVTKLVTTVRKALGDKTKESDQMFAMASVSATSLDVVRNYAMAMDAQSRNKFEDARAGFLKAVELDPKFGIGYQGLAVVSRNLGRLDDADKYIKEALRTLDGMTERERFVTRGMYYRVSGDYQQCVKEYGELVSRYAGDAVGHNQRALCLSKLRDMRGAVEEMRQVVRILPTGVVFRDNLALYANYAGDFQTAEREARTVKEPEAYATLALAFAQLGQGQLREATDTYQKLAKLGALGASFAASGAGDLALYEGRLSDAAGLFEQGVTADLAAKNPNKAATKLAWLAYAHVLLGHKGAAAAAADKAMLNSKAVPIRFLAARIFVETGADAKARTLASGLAAELPAEPQAYGKIIEGEIALKNGDPRQAVKLLTEANGLLDTWLGRFDLGRAYLELRAFPQADSEFDRCIKRRGEALSLFADEEPTYGYFPAVYYYQGRVREGLNNAGAADSYRAYLDIRGKSSEDPLLPDVRRRAASAASSGSRD